MAIIDSIRVGDALPTLEHPTDEVGQFLYNAALWNAHRIHFDLPYATEVEGYPGLVVAGPLMGDWLAQCVDAWLDVLGSDGMLVSISYSNRQAAYVGETLTTRGTVTAVDTAAGIATVDLAVTNAAGEVITPGSARVRV